MRTSVPPLGEYGEKMTGPLMFHERLDPDGEINNFVRYVSTFQIGG
jgi:hypothetical protein